MWSGANVPVDWTSTKRSALRPDFHPVSSPGVSSGRGTNESTRDNQKK